MVSELLHSPSSILRTNGRLSLSISISRATSSIVIASWPQPKLVSYHFGWDVWQRKSPTIQFRMERIVKFRTNMADIDLSKSGSVSAVRTGTSSAPNSSGILWFTRESSGKVVQHQYTYTIRLFSVFSRLRDSVASCSVKLF